MSCAGAVAPCLERIWVAAGATSRPTRCAASRAAGCSTRGSPRRSTRRTARPAACTATRVTNCPAGSSDGRTSRRTTTAVPRRCASSQTAAVGRVSLPAGRTSGSDYERRQCQPVPSPRGSHGGHLRRRGVSTALNYWAILATRLAFFLESVRTTAEGALSTGGRGVGAGSHGRVPRRGRCSSRRRSPRSERSRAATGARARAIAAKLWL